jgi:hypothetical protein
MKTFIVEVVSNGSLDVYPDNTLSSFANYLPEPIVLEYEDNRYWEVALMEIAYPTRYINVTDGKFRFKGGPHKPSHELSIPKGFYSNVESVILAMHKALNNIESSLILSHASISLKVDYFSRKILFNFKDEDAVLNLASRDLANILGFPSPCVIPGTMKESMLPYDIQRIHTIMVYTDIIEHGIIGNTKAPILRSFPLMPKFKDESILLNQQMNYHSFDNLQFKKVLKSSFHSIKIDLRSCIGEKIPFAGIGNTRLTLLFRQVST